MWTIRHSESGDAPLAIEIWRRSVDATHDFLAPEDRAEIEELVRGFLPEVPLTFAEVEDGRAAGFMVLSEGHLEALFIDPQMRGRGAGRALVEHALSRFPALLTDVNEQNAQAVGFYERMGFSVVDRSPRDDQGRPYPLLHLRHGAAARS
ncbi:acetyltransferase [Stappia sp. ICDLI1TA098]